jgi:hypothetical protein
VSFAREKLEKRIDRRRTKLTRAKKRMERRRTKLTRANRGVQHGRGAGFPDATSAVKSLGFRSPAYAGCPANSP